MAPSLCVSAQPLHCFAIGGAARLHYLPHFNSQFNTLLTRGKISKYHGWNDERWNFYFPPQKTCTLSLAG